MLFVCSRLESFLSFGVEWKLVKRLERLSLVFCIVIELTEE